MLTKSRCPEFKSCVLTLLTEARLFKLLQGPKQLLTSCWALFVLQYTLLLQGTWAQNMLFMIIQTSTETPGLVHASQVLHEAHSALAVRLLSVREGS